MASSSPSDKYPPFLANAPSLQNEKATLLQARSNGGGWGLAPPPLPAFFAAKKIFVEFSDKYTLYRQKHFEQHQ